MELGCRFCGKAVTPPVERCPHCNALLGPRDLKPALRTGGRQSFIADTTREARIFLVGLGVLLLVLFTSAALTGTKGFEDAGDRSSLFYLVALNKNAIGLLGAGLLATGLGFWLTNRIAFAYAGGLVWFALVLSPFYCFLSGPPPRGPTRSVTVSPLAGPRVIVGAIGWVALACLPLYRFKDLAAHREKIEE